MRDLQIELQIELQIAVVGANETVRRKSVTVQAQEYEFRQRAHVWFDEFRQRVHTIDGCIDMTST